MSQVPNPLVQFLDALASRDPVPGGGSTAALTGATAGGLVGMVCRVTIGKRGSESVENDLRAALDRAETLRGDLTNLIQRDGDAYMSVVEAYRLARKNTAREPAIQRALQHATDVPLRVAESCAEILTLADSIAAKVNVNAASDLGVGAILADAGLRAAMLTAATNLKMIRDEEFVRVQSQRANQVTVSADNKLDNVLSKLDARTKQHANRS